MSDDVILGVHSNVRKGQIDPETGQAYGFDAGHAWISVTRDGKTTNYAYGPTGIRASKTTAAAAISGPAWKTATRRPPVDITV